MTLRKHRILSFLVALVMLFGMNINAYADIIEPLDTNIEEEVIEGEEQEEEFGLGEEEQEEAKDEEEQPIVEEKETIIVGEEEPIVDAEEDDKEGEEPLALMSSMESPEFSIMSAGTYTALSGTLTAIGQSTNGHIIGRYAWITPSLELYVALSITGPTYQKTLVNLSYNGTPLYPGNYELSEGTHYDKSSSLTVNGENLGSYNWLIVKLGQQNFTEPMYIGLDYTENGFDAWGSGAIKIDFEELTVTYNPNGGSGTVTDSNNPYIQGETVTVLPNGYTRANHTFTGWNTSGDGSGTAYQPGETFSMPAMDVVLYAQWVPDNMYSVTYDGNGGSGSVIDTNSPYFAGSTVTVIANGFSNPKNTFTGWSTSGDGSGTAYQPGETFSMPTANVVLYAQWSPNIGKDLSISDYSGIYDSAAHSISINNLLLDDVVYYSLTNNGSDWTTTKPEFTNVTTGSVTVYVKVENANYQDRTGSGTVTITPRPVTILSNDASKTYDGTALTNKTHSITAGSLAPEEVIDSVSITGTITNAGSVPNTISGAVIKDGSIDTTSNYNITYDPGTLTINKITIVLTADSDSKIYDGTPLTNDGHTITTGAFVGSEGLDTVKVVGSQTYVGSSANTITGHTLKSGTLADNYNISYLPGTLTINKANISITVTANSDSKVYDGNPLIDNGSSLTSGTLISGDDLQVTVEGTITNVGSVTNEITLVKIMNGTEDVTENYKITPISGTLTINKVTIVLTANSASKAYDGTPLTNSGHTITTGAFIGSEGLDTVSVVGSQTYVGSSANTITGHSLKEGTLVDNYNISYLPGTLTITKADIAITITANSNSKVYDGNPLTDSGSSLTSGTLASGDKLEVKVEGTITDVGTEVNKITEVKVMNGTTDVSDNYKITPINGTLEVTKRTATIVVDNASKVFGTDDPTFTGKVEDLVKTDDLGTVSFIRNGTDEVVGNYPGVLRASYTPNPNYTVNVTYGNFQIIPAEGAQLVVNGYTGVYDGKPHSININNLLKDDIVYYSLTNSGNDWTTIKPEFTDVSSTVVYVLVENENFEDRTKSASVTIEPVTIVLTANSDSKVYDGSPLTNGGYTITTGSFVGSEGLENATVSGSQTNVGSSENIITGHELKNNTLAINYNISYLPGNLTITLGTGDEFKVVGYTGIYDGLQHGVSVTGQMPGDLIEYSLNDEDWSTNNPLFKEVSTTTVYVRAINPNYSDRSDSALVSITARPISITAGSATKVFDNQPLINNSYTLTSGTIVEGEELFDVTVTGTITQVGSVPNVPSNAEIGIIEGPHTTSNYAITYVNGTLNITQPFIPPTLYQVNFIAGNGGSLEGTTTTNAIAGTVWSMITVPTPVADEGFEFIGWSPEFPTNIYQNWTFTASFQELEIEIIEEPIPEAPPVEEEEEVVEIIEEPIPEATPILPRTGQSDPMFLYGIGALLSGLLLRRKRR